MRTAEIESRLNVENEKEKEEDTKLRAVVDGDTISE